MSYKIIDKLEEAFEGPESFSKVRTLVVDIFEYPTKVILRVGAKETGGSDIIDAVG